MRNKVFVSCRAVPCLEVCSAGNVVCPRDYPQRGLNSRPGFVYYRFPMWIKQLVLWSRQREQTSASFILCSILYSQRLWSECKQKHRLQADRQFASNWLLYAGELPSARYPGLNISLGDITATMFRWLWLHAMIWGKNIYRLLQK